MKISNELSVGAAGGFAACRDVLRPGDRLANAMALSNKSSSKLSALRRSAAAAGGRCDHPRPLGNRCAASLRYRPYLFPTPSAIAHAIVADVLA